MEEGMCQFWSSPKEIEYSNEDKIIFYFFRLFLCLHFISICVMLSLTYFFAFVNLPIKLSKKFCSPKSNYNML
jgi:hypothetical protein